MADNISKNADGRKLFKKVHGDGEDPVIIAQRFLNIFRQLHIFSNERKDAFNRMILDQPPEIRGMFGSLPGGSVLQEYVDELEQKSGVSREHTENGTISSELSDEISKAKILATALAEAQIQANAQLQAAAPQIQAPAPAPAAASGSGNAPAYNGPAKIVADASFAKEIAAAFSQALKFTEESRKDETKQLAAAIITSQEKMAKVFAEKGSPNTDLSSAIVSTQEKMAQAIAENTAVLRNIPAAAVENAAPAAGNGSNKEIMDAIMESQNRMAQMIMQHNTVAASSNNNANNIQINTALPPMDNLIRDIVKAQSDLFREVSATQTKELSTIISLALKESQQLSTQTIVEAMERMQKENRVFWEKQTAFAPHYAVHQPYDRDDVQEAVSTAAEPIKPKLRPIPVNDTETVEEEFQIPEVNPLLPERDKELNELFSGDTDTAEPDKGLETPSKKKKKKKKKKNKTAENIGAESGSDESGLDFSLFDDGVHAAAKLKDGIKDGLSNFASSLFKKGDNNSVEDDFKLLDTADDFSEKEILGSLTQENAEPPVNKTELIPEGAENNPESTVAADEAEEGEWTWEEIPVEETEAAEPEAEAIPESTAAADEAEDGEWTWEEVPVEETEAAEPEAEAIPESIAATDEAENGEWAWEEVPVEETEAAEPEAEAIPESIAATDEAEEGEWAWEEVPVEETEAAEPEAEAILEGTAAADEAEDGEWTWEEVPVEETQAAEPEAEAILEGTAETDEAEDGEWAWEEVPVEETQAAEPETEAVLEGTAADEDEEGEWAWEEVPVEEPEAAEPEAKAIPESTAAADETEEGEWAWEYEEVPEEENIQTGTAENIPLSDEAVYAEGQDTEETDWEWDEVPVEETEAAEPGIILSETAADETEDGEWAWEYEEVPEEENMQTELKDTDIVPEITDANATFDTTVSSAVSEPAETGSITAQSAPETIPAPPAEETVPDPYGLSSDEDNFNPLYNGNLIFQDKVYEEQAAEGETPAIPFDDIDIGLTEVEDEKDQKEPYIHKDDIIG